MSKVPKPAKWAIASNTPDVWRAALGETIRGVLFEALPLSDRSLSRGTRTLVFESGWGITVSSTGTFWTESPEAISRAIELERKKLEENQAEITNVLHLAGALS